MPAPAPSSTTAATMSHVLSFVFFLAPAPPPWDLDTGPGGATLFATPSLTEGCWIFACGSCDLVLKAVSDR